MPDNVGDTKSRIRKVSKQTTKNGSNAAKRKIAIWATKPKLTDGQKQEARRVRAAEKHRRYKEIGPCRDYKSLAVPRKTRCPNCYAEKHSN